MTRLLMRRFALIAMILAGSGCAFDAPEQSIVSPGMVARHPECRASIVSDDPQVSARIEAGALSLDQQVMTLDGRTNATDPMGYWYSCDCLWRARSDEIQWPSLMLRFVRTSWPSMQTVSVWR